MHKLDEVIDVKTCGVCGQPAATFDEKTAVFGGFTIAAGLPLSAAAPELCLDCYRLLTA